MTTGRRLLLGATGAVVGALLGCSIWFGTARTLLARSRTPLAATPSATAPAADSAAPVSPRSEAVDPPSEPESPSPAEEAFQALSARLQSRLKGSDDRREAARETIAPLQAFIRKYPDAAASDKAYLSLGNMQLAVGESAAAIAAFQHVASQPRDAKLQPIATLMMAQAQAQAGQIAEARTALKKLVETTEGSPVQQAAVEALARLSVAPGQRPPAFLMKDLNGHSQSPDLYKGKVLLIDFWATWCGPCQEEIPNLKRLYQKYHDHGFAILGISLDSQLAPLKEFLREQSIPWPQLCDRRGAKGELARRMGVLSIPTMILVDREGVIRSINARGPALEKAIQELIEQT